MSGENGGNGKFGFSENDWWMLLLAVVAGGSMGVFGIHSKMDAARGWLLEHGIVVQADHAVLSVPGRIGFDTPRLAIAAGVVLVAVAAVWRHFMKAKGADPASAAAAGAGTGAKRGDPS